MKSFGDPKQIDTVKRAINTPIVHGGGGVIEN